MAMGVEASNRQISRLFLTPPLTSPDLPAPVNELCRRQLAETELEKLSTLKGKRYLEFLTSRALLRHALTLTFGPEYAPAYWTVRSVEHAPPAIDSPETADWHCSVSHSRGRVAVALSYRYRCGVDIEAHRHRRNLPAIIDHYFSAGEKDYLSQLTNQERMTAFYRLWTLKEAWYKAEAHGNVTQVLSGMDFSKHSQTDKEELASWWQPMDQYSLAFAGHDRPGLLWLGWPGQAGKVVETSLQPFHPRLAQG